MKVPLNTNSEVDKLGDRLRSDAAADDLRMLDEFRFGFADAYEQVISITKKVAQTEVTGRPAKSTAAIIEKLRRESTRLSQMQDIAGCRVLVPDIATQDMLTRSLVCALNDPRELDRRDKPSHGYRAVHIVVSIAGRNVEIQIRTSLQQFWAALSEKISDSFGNDLKYGVGDPGILMQLHSLSSGVELVERQRPLLEFDVETARKINEREAHIRFMGEQLLVALGVQNDFLD